MTGRAALFYKEDEMEQTMRGLISGIINESVSDERKACELIALKLKERLAAMPTYDLDPAIRRAAMAAAAIAREIRGRGNE
jgi:hypothetical protein